MLAQVSPTGPPAPGMRLSLSPGRPSQRERKHTVEAISFRRDVVDCACGWSGTVAAFAERTPGNRHPDRVELDDARAVTSERLRAAQHRRREQRSGQPEEEEGP